jgi:hypothetical protein
MNCFSIFLTDLHKMNADPRHHPVPLLPVNPHSPENVGCRKEIVVGLLLGPGSLLVKYDKQ